MVLCSPCPPAPVCSTGSMQGNISEAIISVWASPLILETFSSTGSPSPQLPLVLILRCLSLKLWSLFGFDPPVMPWWLNGWVPRLWHLPGLFSWAPGLSIWLDLGSLSSKYPKLSLWPSCVKCAFPPVPLFLGLSPSTSFLARNVASVVLCRCHPRSAEPASCRFAFSIHSPHFHSGENSPCLGHFQTS